LFPTEPLYGCFVQPQAVPVDGRQLASDAKTAALSKIDVGATLWGSVKKHETYGMFIEIDGPGHVSGMCHVSELADEFVRKPESLYAVNDRVRCKVIRLDVEKGKLYLGLKPSYFEGETASDPSQVSTTSNERKTFADSDDEDGEEKGGDESDGSDEESEEEAGESEDGSDEGSDDEMEQVEEPKVKTLEVEGGMDWEVELTGALTGAEAASAVEAAGDGADDSAGKSKKRDKKRLKEAREAEVAAKERARLSGDAAPQSLEDFERAVLTAQSSSFLWIKFIAWHVSKSEVAAARAVAERALEAIHFREDNERFNVWMAYLNLENMYGEPTPAEAVAKVRLVFGHPRPHSGTPHLSTAWFAKTRKMNFSHE